MRQHINPDDINMSELLAIVGQNNRRQLEQALEELCHPVIQLFLKKYRIPPVHQPTIIAQAKKILSEAVHSYDTTDQHDTNHFTGFEAYFEICLERELSDQLAAYQMDYKNERNDSTTDNITKPLSFDTFEQKVFASYLLNQPYNSIAKKMETDVEKIRACVDQCAQKISNLVDKQPGI